MNAKKLRIITAAALALILAGDTFADSARRLVREGNSLYAKKQYNQAVAKYDQALAAGPHTLEPEFNKANSYYRLDDLAAAIDLYKQVAAETKDMKLVAKAKYNLGDCYFKEGLKQKDSDLQKALEAFQNSITSWRAVLDLQPDNTKAAKNIEVARLTIKDIIDQINKKKQEQEKQTDRQQKTREKLKDLLQKQKDLANQTDTARKDANEGILSPEQTQKKSQDIADKQSQLRNQTDQTLRQMQQQDPNNPLSQQQQQASQELEKAADRQKKAEDQLQNSDLTNAQKQQQKAAEHIENALKAVSQNTAQNLQQQSRQQKQEQQNKPRNEQSQQQEPNEQNQQHEQQQMQEPHAPDATAEEILNREQQDRQQRQMMLPGGYQKVDKDW